MNDLIKQICIQVIESSYPTKIMSGSIEKIDLTLKKDKVVLKVSDKMLLTNKDLVFMPDLQSYKEGDEVVLLRQSGGQMYYVIGKGEVIADDTL